jgi:hypothetical protein
MAVQDGQIVLRELPEQILQRFAQAGIADPFVCGRLEQELQEETQ